MKQGLDEPYVFCDLVLKSSELKFAPLNPNDQKKKLDIIVYLKDYTIYCDNSILLEAVFLILYDLLWRKIDMQISGIKTVYFSPSGLLHRINLQAIPISKN